MSRVTVGITLPGKIVDDGGGNFYYKITPRVSFGRARLEQHEIDSMIVPIRKAIQKKLKEW